jgi:hypothetical protein
MKTADPQPMFVEYVLNALWKAYQRVLTEAGDSEAVKGLIKNFNLEQGSKGGAAVCDEPVAAAGPCSDGYGGGVHT